MTTHEMTRAVHWRRAIAIVTATVGALVIWLIATPVGGLDLIVHSAGPDAPIGPVPVVTATVAAGLAAWALLTALERLSARPRRVWIINAVVALLISLLGPILDAASLPVALVLISMHLCVGIVLLWLLGGTARVRSPRRPPTSAV
jgi:hypothetical protein